jgi:hypothetical protein
VAALDGSMRTCIIRAQLVPLVKVAADELETCTEIGAVAYKFEKIVSLLDVKLPTL